ncbi:MAG: DUF3455 domain-containing protein [Casimicrobiaceae bacterium]
MLQSISLVMLLAAAGSASAGVDNTSLPEPVRVPAGHVVALETLGTGEITYECREKKDQAGAFEWAFVAPVATLSDMQQKAVGKYYGGPTWEAADGSKVTGKQVAVAPGMAGSIPLQLVKAEPAMGDGAMTGITYIQRLETKGGVAPAAACNSAALGAKQQVGYQAKYVFYKQA